MISFVNIISGFVTSAFRADYMVRSSVIEEAERRGAVFEGWVGEREEDRDVLFRRKLAEGTAESVSSKDEKAREEQRHQKDQSPHEGTKQ